MIQRGWREQYDRMQRSHRRLMGVIDGTIHVGSDDARDAIFHFVQDAYHLKDWLINDAAVQPAVATKSDVEAAVTNSQELSICADLANGTKHGKLSPNRKPRSGDPTTAFVRQVANVVMQFPQEGKAEIPTIRVRLPLAEGTGDTPEPVDVSQAAAPFASVLPPSGGTITHSWEVESSGQVWLAQDLADRVLTAWDTWLTARGLI